MKKLKVGLAGCGRISGSHRDAIRRLGDQLELAAACDPEPDRLKDFDAAPWVKRYSDYSEMLAKGGLDLVVLCTPSGLHADQGAAAAAKKIHVLTEKPMATSLKDADRLIKACQDGGANLYVVKQVRLNRNIRFLKTAIELGRFGRIHHVGVNVFWTRPQSYYDSADWRGSKAMDGGAFLNQASHYVDLLCHLFGDVRGVFGLTRTLARDVEVEDSGIAAFEFESGALGSMSVSMLAFPKNFEGSITVLGETGTVKLGGIAVDQVEAWEFADYHDMDREVRESLGEPAKRGEGHLGFYRMVLSHLRGGAPAVDGFEGRKSLEIIEALHRSAGKGAWVSMK